MVKRNHLEPEYRETLSKKHSSSSTAESRMGRPPGAKNGTSNGGGKQTTKPPAGNGKGPGRPSGSAAATAASVSEKEKTTQDRSQLNFPYDIRLNGYASLQNAVSKGTPKIKRILTEECDYIMECRVCRNLFRSLPNFITHKLNYCKKAFDSTWCIGLSNLIQTGESSSATSFNIEYEVDPELVLVNANADLTPSKDDSSHSSIELPSTRRTRSVADLYSELAERTKARKEKESTASQLSIGASSPGSANIEDNVIRLKLKPLSMPCTSPGKFNVVSGGGMKSVVVQQQLVSDDLSKCDKTCATSVEIVKKDTAIMGPDGKVLCTAPEKGIERVISKLTAQLKALEEKEAQKAAALAKNAIICDVCKTVFDSDKALRQHKRESLDCGKIWGFKSPIHHDKTTSSVCLSSENSTIPHKKAKIPSDSENNSEGLKESATAISSQSGHLSRVFTPSKGRKSLHPRHYSSNGISPTKFKRNLSLSPVKKIKMKYIKLDSSSTTSGPAKDVHAFQGPLFVACPRCSKSFTTRYEMANHLVVCTGVINHRILREFEPRPEKMRIAVRHDFNKPNPPSSLLTPRASPTPSCNIIVHESHYNDSTTSRDRHTSGASSSSSSRRGTPTSEVNNNKQYKPIYEQNAESSSSISSSEEDNISVAPEETVPQIAKVLRTSGAEEVDSDDITSHDSGVSSASSTKKVTKKLLSGPAKLKIKQAKVKATKPLSSKNSPSSNPVSKSEKKTKKKVSGGTGSSAMSARLEGRNLTKTSAAVKVKRHQLANTVNLRKTISSRLRKSRRIQHSSPQAKQKKPHSTSCSTT